MKEEFVRIERLKSYAQFLLEKRLDDFVKEDFIRARELDLPLVKLFSHLPDSEFINILRKSTKDLFEEIIEGQAIAGSYKLVADLKNNRLPGLPKDKLNIRDVALSYNIRKHSFFKFLPEYTTNPQEIVSIVTEIENFFTHRQELVFQAYAEITTEILKTSEDNFKRLAEASFEGIIIHNNSEIIDCNQALASMYGYTREELIGKSLKILAPESAHQLLFEKANQNYDLPYESEGVRRDGFLFPIEIMGRQIVHNDQKLRVIGIRDISERKKLEEEKKRSLDQLQKEKDFHQILIDNAESMILAIDRNMTITAWNQRLEESSGIKKEDTIGKNYYDFFPSYKDTDEYMQEVWKGKKVILKEKPFRQRKGFYDAEIIPLFNEQQEVIGALSYSRDVTERVLKEEKLKEQEYFIKNIANSSPSLIYVADSLHNRFVYGNTPLLQFLGMTEDEFLKMDSSNILNIIHPDDIPAILRRHEQYSTSPENNNYYLEYRCRDYKGEWRWLASTTKVFKRTPDGRMMEELGIAIDITEKKQMEEALAEKTRIFQTQLEQLVEERTHEVIKSEKKYRFLADVVPQIFWTADPDGNIDYYNKNWFEYTGLNFEESKGSGWTKIFHPHDLEPTLRIWKESVRTGKPYQYEYRYLRASDQTYRWHLGRAVPLKDDSGNIVKWFGTSTDIHDHKINEESMKMQALVLKNMDEGVSVVDENGIIIYTNEAEDRIFGYEPGGLIGKPVTIQNAYPPEENKRIVDEVINQLRTHGSWKGEWLNKKKDGTLFTTFAHITTLSLENKILFVCVQRDVTEEKKFRETILQQNEELLKINNDLDNFIYTASHDLKAPVSNIEGLMGTLMDTVSEETHDSTEFNMVTGLMYQSINRFKNTIQDLTDITKAQKGVDEEQAMIDVCIIAVEVKESIREDIQKTGAEVLVDTINCPLISFSIKNFRSIVFNLMSNAIKYRSPERKPQVKITTYHIDNYAVLEVKDNGLGIRDDQKAKIFEMFKRLHDHVEGTGIGLYIVKRMVDNAGGKIEVESEEGKGSTFRIYFPDKILLKPNESTSTRLKGN